jgi:hypothetical protein
MKRGDLYRFTADMHGGFKKDDIVILVTVGERRRNRGPLPSRGVAVVGIMHEGAYVQIPLTHFKGRTVKVRR